MCKTHKLAKAVLAVGLGVAMWAAIPGRSLSTVAGSSRNGSSLN